MAERRQLLVSRDWGVVIGCSMGLCLLKWGEGGKWIGSVSGMVPTAALDLGLCD